MGKGACYLDLRELDNGATWDCYLDLRMDTRGAWISDSDHLRAISDDNFMDLQMRTISDDNFMDLQRWD